MIGSYVKQVWVLHEAMKSGKLHVRHAGQSLKTVSRNRRTAKMGNNDRGAVGSVRKGSDFRPAPRGSMNCLKSIAVLVMALVLYRARQPVDTGGRFSVQQAPKCERSVGVAREEGLRRERLVISSSACEIGCYPLLSLNRRAIFKIIQNIQLIIYFRMRITNLIK